MHPNTDCYFYLLLTYSILSLFTYGGTGGVTIRARPEHDCNDRIIGLNAMNRYDLRVRTEGYSTKYDPTCNPSIFNEFATAAFRYLQDHII